jgi:hypothetical protein
MRAGIGLTLNQTKPVGLTYYRIAASLKLGSYMPGLFSCGP